MKKIARAEKNKNNGLLPILASRSKYRFLVLCHDRVRRDREPRL